ncbi:MAG: fumarylacetoacetate hydrolase family protein [Oscillospiraceae bacterium]|nr:fumarylacetoacetate hydrolase family protein [Oscillospiraceae bacterium]
MKITNIRVNDAVHLAAETPEGLVDVTAAGFPHTLQELVAGADRSELEALLQDSSLPVVSAPVCANLFTPAPKLVCVGLNYREHAMKAGFALPEFPTIFSKFDNALVPSGAEVELPPWEVSYDYEAELVIVIGKKAWGVSEADAKDYIFGYTCGDDLSCRESQNRTSQWLVGKTMPGFGPCGPFIVTADCFDPEQPHAIRSYVNGEVRQNSDITDMIFNCSQIVSYVSKYTCLEPGDLIFTGTPSGVALENKENPRWLKPGDLVEIEIEGIGRLQNRMK